MKKLKHPYTVASVRSTGSGSRAHTRFTLHEHGLSKPKAIEKCEKLSEKHPIVIGYTNSDPLGQPSILIFGGVRYSKHKLKKCKSG